MFAGIVPTGDRTPPRPWLSPPGLAACAQHAGPAANAQEARERLLALAVRAEGPRKTPVLDPLCLYGGTRY